MICVASSRPASITLGSYLMTNVLAENSSESGAAGPNCGGSPSAGGASAWTSTSSSRNPSNTDSVARPTTTRPPSSDDRYDSAICRTRVASVRCA